MEESLRYAEVSKKDLRNFGFVMAGCVCTIFGLFLPLVFNRPFPVWPFTFGVISGTLGFFFPLSLKHFYRVWMKFGVVVGTINTFLLLTLVYYLIITPMGLLARIFAKDPMARKFDPNINSYKNKRSDAIISSSMERPF